jgi:hypothetical protein
MTRDTQIGVIDLDTEIKEVQLQLRQAEIGDKERIAKQLEDLRKKRRGQTKNFFAFRSKMHDAAEIADSRTIQGINSD